MGSGVGIPPVQACSTRDAPTAFPHATAGGRQIGGSQGPALGGGAGAGARQGAGSGAVRLRQGDGARWDGGGPEALGAAGGSGAGARGGRAGRWQSLCTLRARSSASTICTKGRAGRGVTKTLQQKGRYCRCWVGAGRAIQRAPNTRGSKKRKSGAPKPIPFGPRSLH